jgi:hypothetical protein
MSVQRRNITTEATRRRGVCTGIRSYVIDGAKGGSGWEGILSRRKRGVQRKQSFPILPLRSVFATGFLILSAATASSGPAQCLASASRSATQLSDGRRCGQGRMRALWRGVRGMRPSASTSEAVYGAQRRTLSLEARRIRRATRTSANREREDGSEGRAKQGEAECEDLSQRTPCRMQNLAYILFHRTLHSRARIREKIY